MFLFSLSWSQGWVDFTCTDSCCETLRLLYVFSCASFSLYIIGNCFVYHSRCNRFTWILYFICICGKKLIPSSRYIPSIHQGAQPPISFLPGWMSTSHFCGCSLQWIFVSQNSIVSHDVSWIAPSLSVMISGFISIAEDGLLSIFNPWFKIHSRLISHFFIYSSVQVHDINFHLFDVLNGVAESILGWVVFEICSCLKYSRRGSDLSYCLYLFIYLFFSHGSALF